MTGQAKNGPGHDNFESVREWYLDPSLQMFNKPIVILQNEHTHSAGEIMLLGFHQINNCIFLGDTTSGAFSNTLWRQLPNGWLFSLSSYLYKDASGKCYEGIGLAPDIQMTNSISEISNGKDILIEKAVSLF